MDDFIERHRRYSAKQRKAWKKMKEAAQHEEPVYSLTVTLRQDVSESSDISTTVEMANIGPDVAEEALRQIRLAALEGGTKLNPRAAKLLGLSTANHKGFPPTREEE